MDTILILLSFHFISLQSRAKLSKVISWIFSLCYKRITTFCFIYSLSGFIGLRCPHLLLADACRNLYQEILSPACLSIKSKFIILKNIQCHLMEDEERLQKAAKAKSPGNLFISLFIYLIVYFFIYYKCFYPGKPPQL